MSKERARRREEREREAAIRRAARAAEQERRERQVARKEGLRRARSRVGLGPRPVVGRPGGTLARRRRRQHQVTLLVLLVPVLLVLVVRPDWPTRLAAVVVAVLAYPVLRTLLFRRV